MKVTFKKFIGVQSSTYYRHIYNGDKPIGHASRTPGIQRWHAKVKTLFGETYFSAPTLEMLADKIETGKRG